LLNSFIFAIHPPKKIMSQVGSFSRSSDMFAAIRRTKSAPIWIAVIAVLTVVVTLGTVVVSNIVQSHASRDSTAAAQSGPAAHLSASASALRIAPELDSGVRQATAQSAASDAADIAVFAKDGAKDGDAAAKSGASPSGSATHAGDARASAAGYHAQVQSKLAARAQARRNAAEEAARTNATLRADIARYNAERADRRKAVPLRAASAPNLHSLWDEIPQPLSDIYRN
jgi:hypothetical protein